MDNMYIATTNPFGQTYTSSINYKYFAYNNKKYIVLAIRGNSYNVKLVFEVDTTTE